MSKNTTTRGTSKKYYVKSEDGTIIDTIEGVVMGQKYGANPPHENIEMETETALSIESPLPSLQEMVTRLDSKTLEAKWASEKADAEIVSQLGEEMYARNIKQKVQNEHKGEYLILDVDSGKYVISSNIADTTMRIYKQKPDARLYTIRIGYDSAFKV